MSDGVSPGEGGGAGSAPSKFYTVALAPHFGRQYGNWNHISTAALIRGGGYGTRSTTPCVRHRFGIEYTASRGGVFLRQRDSLDASATLPSR